MCATYSVKNATSTKRRTEKYSYSQTMKEIT